MPLKVIVAPPIPTREKIKSQNLFKTDAVSLATFQWNFVGEKDPLSFVKKYTEVTFKPSSFLLVNAVNSRNQLEPVAKCAWGSLLTSLEIPDPMDYYWNDWIMLVNICRTVINVNSVKMSPCVRNKQLVRRSHLWQHFCKIILHCFLHILWHSEWH